MTIQEAQDLWTPVYSNVDKQWLKGILFLHKKDPSYGTGDDQVTAGHTVVYFAPFSEDLTKDEIIQMYKWGFHIDDEFQCWALYH